MVGTTVTLDYGELRAAATVLRDSADDLEKVGAQYVDEQVRLAGLSPAGVRPAVALEVTQADES